jgi:hypothetical protein
MPIDADNSRATEAIRKRAVALGSSGGGVATEAELLAAVVDGALCFEEIDEQALLRCVEAFGPDTVIDAFLEADKVLPAAEDRLPAVDAGRKPVLPFLKKAASPGEFWSYRPYWIAAAAAVALGFVVLWPRRNCAAADIRGRGQQAGFEATSGGRQRRRGRQASCGQDFGRRSLARRERPQSYRKCSSP